MGSSSWFVFFKALFLETLHQNQLFEGTPLGLQSLSKILKHLCAYLSQIYAYHNPLTPNITNINVLLTMPIHSRRQMDIELIK